MATILDAIAGFINAILSVIRVIKDIFIDVGKFISKIWEFLVDLPDFIVRFLQWAYDFIMALPSLLLDSLVSGLTDFMANQISGAIFIQRFFEYASSISAGIQFWLHPFHVSFGFGCMLSAYIIRFIIRRLPIIG